MTMWPWLAGDQPAVSGQLPHLVSSRFAQTAELKLQELRQRVGRGYWISPMPATGAPWHQSLWLSIASSMALAAASQRPIVFSHVTAVAWWGLPIPQPNAGLPRPRTHVPR